MAKIVHDLVVNNTRYDLGTVHYIVGTGTTAGTWLGSDSSIQEYYDGLTIAYKLNVAGASTTTLNINGLGAKTVYRGGTTKLTTQYSVNSVVLLTYTTTSSTGCWQCAEYDTNTNYYHTPSCTTSTKSSTATGGTANLKLATGNGISDMYAPLATASTPGVTVVYPEASCTTFSSDAGTVTPAAVQKGAKLFAYQRLPDSSVTETAIPRIVKSAVTVDGVKYSGLENTGIKIESVTNTKDSSKTAHVLSIPAEGGKKMVYGYCTDQTDGTSFIGGVFDADATTFPYASGLAIGGTSGNLLWKGKQVATTDMLSDTNTAHSHSAGVGLTGSGSAGTSGTYTYKVNLVNETVSSNAASYTAGGSSKFYAVQLDKNSKLGVYVPWTDNNTHYTTGITAGASGTTTNAVATNPYIKVKDDSTHRSQIRLLGDKGLNVKSDASGNVTVGANEVTVSVPTTGWTTDSTYGNKVTITVNGVTAGSNPVADVVLNGSTLAANKTLLEQWSYISKITTAANSVTLYAFETVPTTAFSILMKFI